MKRWLLVAWLLLPSPAVLASEGEDLAARSRSLAATGLPPAKNADAPFRLMRDIVPEMLLREELQRRGPRGSCEASASDVCYDLADARVVYRPARQYMPAIEGLRAESISLRHDRIILKYTFR